MKVITRNPRCHVRIVSLEYGEIPDILLRPVIRQVSTHRRMGNAAGSFQITLLPKKVNTTGLPNDWRDVFGAMDYVEISLEVAPRPPVIVMRGFIDTVTEQGSIADGRPSRTVQIHGRDFGKLLLITKLYYLDGIQQIEIFEKWRKAFLTTFGCKSGEPPPPEHPPLARNLMTDTTQLTPGELLRQIFDAFYEPQQALVLRQLPTVPPLRFFPVVNALLSTNEKELSTIAPDVICFNWAPYTDVWTLMKQYQHLPWRELYVIDEQEGPLLVYRPTPWIDFNGRFVFDGAESGHMGTMLTHQVSEDTIVEYCLSHSEEEVRNYFFTYTDEFGSLAQMVKTVGPLEGIVSHPLTGNPYLVGHQVRDPSGVKRTDYKIMGLRLQEARTQYLDFDHRTSREQIEVRLKEAQEQGEIENLHMTRAFDHAGVLEMPMVLEVSA